MNKLDRVIELLEGVSTTNTLVIQETEALKVVLLNLKIEDAHIQDEQHKHTGITPIADELERVIKSINVQVRNTVANRTELRKLLDEIGIHLEDKKEEL